MDLEWEKDDNGDWTLRLGDVEVYFLTNQQKKDLKKIFEKIKGSED